MDINNRLEREWQNYKLYMLIVRILLGVLGFVLAVVIIVSLFGSGSSDKQGKGQKSMQNATEQAKASGAALPHSAKDLNKTIVKTKVIIKEVNVTAPMRDVLLDMRHNFEADLQSLEVKIQRAPKPSKPPKEEAEEDLVFNMKAKPINIKDLIQAYEESHSYEKAISIANFYAGSKDHKNAAIWAIRASELNTLKEDPWVVFAQANIAMGKKDVALQAIDAYLSKNFSAKLQSLRESIQ
ncbi:MAG: hypothetical protein ACTTIC_04615 [Helicobacteraceae bacterium]